MSLKWRTLIEIDNFERSVVWSRLQDYGYRPGLLAENSAS
jgi:hypothetical protein